MPRGDPLTRFLSTDGDPEIVRRLAWRRSALRFNALLSSHRERPANELTHILNQLDLVSPEVRHRSLGAPETALYVDALVSNSTPSADIAVPVLSRFSPVPGSTPYKFSWTGDLQLDYLPLGSNVLRMHGKVIRDPQLFLDGRCIRLSSLSDGTTIEVPVDGTERKLKHCSLRGEKLEIVDGWRPFGDDFQDGNASIILDPSARKILDGLLQEAIILIGLVVPASLEEMLETSQYLSPIRPDETRTSELPSFSSPALPGVVFVGIQQGDGTWIDARHLAESCFHEHLHNRLYLLNEALPLTVCSPEPQTYFSPWKRTLRGVDGMLHAVYVFSHVAWFWRKVGERVTALRDYAERSVEEQVGQLKIAVGTLTTDELTETGCRVLKGSTEIFHALTTRSEKGCAAR